MQEDLAPRLADLSPRWFGVAILLPPLPHRSVWLLMEAGLPPYVSLVIFHFAWTGGLAYCLCRLTGRLPGSGVLLVFAAGAVVGCILGQWHEFLQYPLFAGVAAYLLAPRRSVEAEM